MKIDWTKWSAIAEILSAIAIVVTLLYLADQAQELRSQTEQNNRLLEQDQSIALSLRAENRLTTAIELANMFNEHPEVWASGLAGEQLDETDATVFDNLMLAFHDSRVFASRAALQLGYESASNYWVFSYGVFLYENPGAREWYEAHVAEDREIERLSEGSVILADFNDRVLAVWDQIEQNEDSETTTE